MYDILYVILNNKDQRTSVHNLINNLMDSICSAHERLVIRVIFTNTNQLNLVYVDIMISWFLFIFSFVSRYLLWILVNGDELDIGMLLYRHITTTTNTLSGNSLQETLSTWSQKERYDQWSARIGEPEMGVE